MGKLFAFIGSILTLNILPGAYKMLESTSIKGNHTVILIGWIFNPIINYFVTLFVNIIDFLSIFISWIPFIGDVQHALYSSPDIDQSSSDAVYEFIKPLLGSSHRNWITHSVLNPYFIAFILCAFIISLIAKFIPYINYIVGITILIIGLTFVCHLLADTMPMSWGKGHSFSKIHVHFWFIKFQMSAFFSKLWLYINAFIAGTAVVKAASPSLEE